MGGTTAKTILSTVLPRKRDIRAEFNTCRRSRTVFFRTYHRLFYKRVYSVVTSFYDYRANPKAIPIVELKPYQ